MVVVDSGKRKVGSVENMGRKKRASLYICRLWIVYLDKQNVISRSLPRSFCIAQSQITHILSL